MKQMQRQRLRLRSKDAKCLRVDDKYESILESMQLSNMEASSDSVVEEPSPDSGYSVEIDDGTTESLDDIIQVLRTSHDLDHATFIPGEAKQEAKVKAIHATFALDGLTCSSCSQAVTEAVNSFTATDHCIEIDKDSIHVALFPEPTLTLIFTIPEQNSSGKDAIVDEIIECIEDVGFGAELVSASEILENRDVENPAGEISSIRTVFLHIEENATVVLDFLRQQEFVKEVEISASVSTKERRKRRLQPKPANDSARESTQSPMSSGATIRMTYSALDIGIRSVLAAIHSSADVQSLGGCGKISLTDASSYQNMADKSEIRRRTEIQNWKRSFFIAASFAIPVALISMVFVHVPGMKDFFHSKAFWNITWEEFLAFLLATPVQFYSGWRFYREAYYSIKSGHLGMSFLIAAGTTAAYVYSIFVVLYNAFRDAPMGERLMQAFETSALLITFVLLGKFLECKVKIITSKAISELSRLAPEFATLVGTMESDGSEQQSPEEKIPLSLLQYNDVLLIRPGEKMPTDGVIIHGTTSIDESMLTGESVPVTKSVNDSVIGGTMNIDGSVRIQVNSIGDDTTLAKIIKLIESAQSSKAPIQEYADYISSIFVPVVFGISILTYIIWASLLNSKALDSVKYDWAYREEGLNDWTLPLLFSISCLVIACPCALGLATPTAVSAIIVLYFLWRFLVIF